MPSFGAVSGFAERQRDANRNGDQCSGPQGENRVNWTDQSIPRAEGGERRNDQESSVVTHIDSGITKGTRNACHAAEHRLTNG